MITFGYVLSTYVLCADPMYMERITPEFAAHVKQNLFVAFGIRPLALNQGSFREIASFFKLI